MDIQNFTVYSFDGNSLDDANYEARILIENSPSAVADVYEIARSDESPLFANKILTGKILQLEVEIKDGGSGSLGELMSWFNVRDNEEKILVVEEIVGGKKWYVNATTREVVSAVLTDFRVNLHIADFVWKSVTPVTDSMTVTSSGQTKSLANSGTEKALLTVEITPNTSKAGAVNKYRMMIYAFNPIRKKIPFTPIVTVMDTASLINDTSISNQINEGSGITSGQLSFNIDTSVGGGLDTDGGICYVDSEQIYYDSISGGVMTVNANGRGWGGTTAASHADNAVLAFSQMLADGSDIMIKNAGEELTIFINDINTATTDIWTEPLDFKAAIEFELDSAIAGSGSISEIVIKETELAKKLWKRLPKTGGLIGVETGGTVEMFVYTGVSEDVDAENGLTIYIAHRAVRQTSMASHSVGDTVRWYQFDLWLTYGNWLADTRTYTDEELLLEPACDLASTNSNLVFTEFGDAESERPFSWKPTIIERTKGSRYYRGNHGVYYADPITEMGMVIKAYRQKAVWRGGNAEISWTFSHPGNITSVSSSGEKRRQYGSWLGTGGDETARCGLFKSKDGEAWEEQWTEDSPATKQNWEAWTRTTTGDKNLGSGYSHVMFIMDGSCRRLLYNKLHFEVNDVTMVLANPIDVSNSGTPEANYHLRCRISITQTGDKIWLDWPMKTSETLTIDVKNRLIYDSDGINAYRAKYKQNTRRLYWLHIPAGGGTFKYVENNVSNVTVDFTYEERTL